MSFKDVSSSERSLLISLCKLHEINPMIVGKTLKTYGKVGEQIREQYLAGRSIGYFGTLQAQDLFNLTRLSVVYSGDNLISFHPYKLPYWVTENHYSLPKPLEGCNNVVAINKLFSAGMTYGQAIADALYFVISNSMEQGYQLLYTVDASVDEYNTHAPKSIRHILERAYKVVV